jgi:hypothetical protein
LKDDAKFTVIESLKMLKLKAVVPLKEVAKPQILISKDLQISDMMYQ